MYRNILVPLDGSPLGESALPVAAAIAKTRDARLRLAYVHSPGLWNRLTAGEGNEVERRADERQKIERLANELNIGGLKADAAVLDGDVIDALVEYAKTVAADLVVMTTHGRGAVMETLLGSVSRALMHRLDAPVVLLRPEASQVHSNGRPWRRLLIALDGSSAGEAMLDRAIVLGSTMNAEYRLVRVVKPVIVGVAVGMDLLPVFDPQATQQYVDAAAKYLDQVAAKLRARGLKADFEVVVDSDPAVAILTKAAREGCDLIAVESHGTQDFERLIYGSVADAVVRGGRAAVLAHDANCTRK